jgi:hypothetical protein
VQNDSILIILENIITTMPYNKENVAITWEECTLRGWLNGEFLKGFSPQDLAAIVEAKLLNMDTRSTPGGNDTVDWVFLLSLDEVKKYFVNNDDRIAKNSEGRAGWWWLRSSGIFFSSYAARVNYDGSVNDGGCDVNRGGVGVRPALWLNLSSLNL